MLRQEQNIIQLNQIQQLKRRSFKCLVCSKYANNSVLTPCGHIFCWACIYKKSNKNSLCPYCKQTCLLNQCYPVYTDHHEQQQIRDHNQTHNNQNSQLKVNAYHNQEEKQEEINSQKQLSSPEIQIQPSLPYQIPARPSARYHTKIFNPNMIGAGLPLIANNLPSNVNMGILIPGPVFVSPLGVNTFSSIEDGKQNDQDFEIGQNMKIKMHIVLVFIIALIVYCLIGQ